MNARLVFSALALVCLFSNPVAAQEAVPINATFGIQWEPVDWSNSADRITESLGAAGLPNGQVIGIAVRDHLNADAGKVSSDYVILFFSATDRVYAEYTDIPAGYDLATYTASFGGPLTVVGGEGRFLGAKGSLTIRSHILLKPFPPFPPPVGTFDIKGVIKTAK